MKELEGQKLTGTFNVLGKEIFGELTLDTKGTSLYLRDERSFEIGLHNNQYIHGQLHDLRKVSLLECVGPPAPGSASRGDKRYSFAELFPHFVIFGDEFVLPDKPSIIEIDFV